MSISVEKSKFNKIAVIGDANGIPLVLQHLPEELVACLIVAAVRPDGVELLDEVSRLIGKPIIVQPKYRTAEYPIFVEEFRKLGCDLIICNSYSMLIRKDLLDIVNGNAVNIHGALLPENRGPNPIQWAIIRGQKETGVTMHYMDYSYDTGDIIDQEVIPINEKDTWLMVNVRMPGKIRSILDNNLSKLLEGTNNRTPQDETRASENPRLDADYPRIDFEFMDDKEIHNLIRAQVSPLKGAYIERGGDRVHLQKWISMEQVAELRTTLNGNESINKVALTKLGIL